MRNLSFLIFLCFTSTVAALSQVDHLTNTLNFMTSLRANFVQQLVDQENNILQQTRGQMTILKPGRFRWQTFGQDEMLIIVNPREIINYDKMLEQVVIQSAANHRSNLPISDLLTGTANIDRDFTVKISRECKACSSCFLLEPKSLEADFTQASLGFKDNKLMFFKLLDNLGQISVFTFTDVQLNIPINRKQFDFKVPANVDIIRSE